MEEGQNVNEQELPEEKPYQDEDGIFRCPKCGAPVIFELRTIFCWNCGWSMRR